MAKKSERNGRTLIFHPPIHSSMLVETDDHRISGFVMVNAGSTKGTAFLWTVNDEKAVPPRTNQPGGVASNAEECVEALCNALTALRAKYESEEPLDPWATYRAITAFYNELEGEDIE